MTTDDDDLETRLAGLVEHHVRHGELPPPATVEGDPALAQKLGRLVRQYLDLHDELDGGAVRAGGATASADAAEVPSIEGFRTIERLGRGGMGAVYKLEDLTLGRTVAAKILRTDAGGAARVADLLREARSMALFSDPRIVRLFEYRADATPPVLIMELVDGFELGQVAPSLEYRQRARIMREICDAVQHAHDHGVQHRDLKPSNIMLDGRLAPKILDFGLSDGRPASGHLRGTPAYMAPEQLDPTRPIDGRTDVYGLGVVLYELLCGAVPFSGETLDATIDAVRIGRPRLPVEVDSRVPEPLQAIALKAMERDPAQRYQTAREMSLDLSRYRDGHPVAARPTLYASTLQARVKPHLDAVADWLRLRLIYPHEAERLHGAYRQLEVREDDWIVSSRVLSYSQIALYLGAFLLLAGSLFYFAAHRFYGTAEGMVGPFLTLGVPFVGLNLAGRWLYARQHQAVGVAFYLAGVSLLPLFLLIAFHETGLWVVPDGMPGQLFDDAVSNRQLQITILAACLWSGWLALRTRTAALSTVFTLLLLLLALAVMSDFGLRSWLEEEDFDLLGLHLAPMVPLYAALGAALERRDSPWIAGPLYVAGAVTMLVTLDLIALDGEMFRHLGVSMQRLQSEQVSNPLLVDTVAALTLNGVLFYGVATAVERRGTDVMAAAGRLLFVIAPFSMLEPLAWLVRTGEYSLRVDWTYLVVSIGIAILSHQRQRKSFYYAGLINTGVALYFIADHHEWFDRPAWAIAVVAAGLLALALGVLLDARRRRRG